ncbi:MAG: superoxide dismutase, partial [Candidatus Komeilibacteria bacterium RIFCSPLOWO2_01_FULL_45_10]
YELPKLNYEYAALEPYIDAETMEIHHTKHHQAYTDKMNAVLEKYPNLAAQPLEELMQSLNGTPMTNEDATAFRNNGGGYLNHKLFFEIMGPKKEVDQTLATEITTAFGSIDQFKQQFSQAAVSRFGSGWAWLARNSAGKLIIYSTTNQDSPLLEGNTPIIGLDVWEHAYYLKYQNRRPEYIEHWFTVLKLL